MYLIDLEPQDLFNIVAGHLHAQKRPSMADDDCAYRGTGGTKCAIGVLIPDEVYDLAMEGISADCLTQVGFPTEDHKVLALGLQHVHDRASWLYTEAEEAKFMDSLSDGLATVASAQGLYYDPNNFTDEPTEAPTRRSSNGILETA